ncbi:PREDICTED: uncharacterized protein LOC101311806 [Fragaria vesca subsp. vesca]
MEPAKIDWKNLEWRFVEDKAYEQINAPKWFDFLNPNDNLLDDHAFFCTPECNHPKTAEDFLRSSSPYKVASSSDVSGISPLGDKVQRDVKLKRRGLPNSSVHPTNNSRFKEDSENQNPNLSTPPNYQAKAMKEAIKSSTEKKQPVETATQSNEVLPRLKSTLSARNLFAGKDILNHITDFCSELKRLAMNAKEREEVEKGIVNNKEEEVKKVESNGEVLGELNGRERERMPLLELGKGKSERMVKKEECKVEVLGEVNGKQRERMPLLDANKGKTEGIEGRIIQEGKRIKKRVDNAENIPVSLNLESVKRKGGEDLLQIRTNPPSPQCFSAARPPSKITPSKASKSRLMEKGGILQGQTNKQVIAMDDSKQVITKDDSTEKAKSVCIADGKEARTLDVFWLKNLKRFADTVRVKIAINSSHRERPFEGIRLLPTGRKYWLGIFLYSSAVGLGSFLLSYIPGLIRSVLTELGISQEMYNLLVIFVVAFSFLAGAWLGFWTVLQVHHHQKGYSLLISTRSERGAVSRHEWESSTKQTTEKALEELASSRDFGKWVVANADRISITPLSSRKTDEQRRRWWKQLIRQGSIMDNILNDMECIWSLGFTRGRVGNPF